MASKSSTTPPRTRNTLLSLLIMVSLVTVLFLFAAGFHFTDKLYWISSYFFQKIRQVFTFSPLTPPTNPEPSLITDLLSHKPSYSRVDSIPDLEAGLNGEDKMEMEMEMEKSDLEKRNHESARLFPTLLSEPTNDFIRKEPEQDLEIQIVNSAPTPIPLSVPHYKSLDRAIEKTTKPSTTPKATYEEWQEPIPIDEENVPEDINGWCFIGQSKGARSCAPVGKMDKCVTGELYSNQMECLQLHPDDAVTPPEYFPTFPPSS